MSANAQCSRIRELLAEAKQLIERDDARLGYGSIEHLEFLSKLDDVQIGARPETVPKHKFDALVEDYKRLQSELKEVQKIPRLHRLADGRDYWGWMGDGSDHLELMSSGMAVLIRAADLRALISMQSPARPWVVADGGTAAGEHKYRTLRQSVPEWTLDSGEALQFFRRKDAELFSEEDEDAWRIIQAPAESLPRSAVPMDDLPDPLGVFDCTHPDCGRFKDLRGWSCRAMKDNACARRYSGHPSAAPQYTVPELTPAMLKAVIDNPLTRIDEVDTRHTRIGWFTLAWEIAHEAATPQPKMQTADIWCMCTKLKLVARDGRATCSICGGRDAYGKSLDRPENRRKILDGASPKEPNRE